VIKKIFLIFIVLQTFFISISCAKKEIVRPIELPSTPVLSVNSRWGVVRSSHLRMRENPNTDSKAIFTLWKGYIIEILSRKNKKDTIEEETNFWYQISFNGLHGWVFGAYMDIYESKDEAEKAVKGE
jgi:hypothetical protein